jgi:hypothetical protein
MDDEDFLRLVRRALNEGLDLCKNRRDRGRPACIEPVLKHLDLELRIKEHELRFRPLQEAAS